jgi:hypothetical protein
MNDKYIQGEHVCDVLPLGDVTYEKLVFQIPVSDRVAGIALWDPDEPGDRLGRTYVYFRYFQDGKPRPIPGDLGTTAWGPARAR